MTAKIAWAGTSGRDRGRVEPEDPSSVGNYRSPGRLGVGGMGRVFLGRSPGGRAVAVKVVHAELVRRPEFRSRFRREAGAARTVSGAFTAPVIDADPDPPLPWPVTSYIAGPSLQEAVADRDPLPPASVPAADYFPGAIRDVRDFDRALTSARVKVLR